MREAISTGASVEEAKEKAIEMLGDIGDADVEFEIIDLPEKKVLGLFGGKEAKVRVYVESLDNDLPKAEKKAEKKIDKKNDKAEKKADKKAEKAEKKAEKEVKTDDKPVTYGVKNVDGLIKYVKDILDHMDIGEVTITSTDIEKGVKLDIEGDGMGAVIGRRGETLDAIQCLASLYCNQEEEGEFKRVVLDTSGYREKREKTLQALAAKTARQALRSGRNQSLEPMNPYERRIIHSAVQEIDGVTSWSVSDGKNRRVIIGFEKGSEPAPKARSSRGGRSRNSSRSSAPKSASAAPAKEPVNELGEGPMYGRIG